jgi:hypothetical protein
MMRNTFFILILENNGSQTVRSGALGGGKRTARKTSIKIKVEK